MKIIEIESTVDKEGKLTIPLQLLGDMGLVSGDTVRLAYISRSTVHPLNSYSEFVITQDGMEAEMREAEQGIHEFRIPNELLEGANIPFDSDIEIICTEGAIIITKADLSEFIPDELCQLFAELGISPKIVRSVLMNGGVPDEQ